MMKEINEVRIGRYLTGEAGSKEREAFEKEMESDPSLREQFMAFRRIWENTMEDIQPSWPVNPAWDRFLNSIPSAKPQQNKIRTRSLSWAVAAALILALGAAVLF